jgi:anti-sigma B factor antagonist
MNLSTEEKNGIVIIHVQESRVDAHNSGELKGRITGLLADGRSKLLVDLADVRFIDSSGLGALIAGFKNAASREGALKLADLQPQVRSMFELTRLHRVFEIFSSVADAIEHF